jgi:hypothetical protein
VQIGPVFGVSGDLRRVVAALLSAGPGAVGRKALVKALKTEVMVSEFDKLAGDAEKFGEKAAEERLGMGQQGQGQQGQDQQDQYGQGQQGQDQYGQDQQGS